MAAYNFRYVNCQSKSNIARAMGQLTGRLKQVFGRLFNLLSTLKADIIGGCCTSASTSHNPKVKGGLGRPTIAFQRLNELACNGPFSKKILSVTTTFRGMVWHRPLSAICIYSYRNIGSFAPDASDTKFIRCA